MARKITVLNRSPAATRSRDLRAPPTKMAALSPANIEQAADLGAGFVLVKLRHAMSSLHALHTDEKQPPLPPDTEIPVMPRARLVTALYRGGKLAGVVDLRKRPADNHEFMRKLAYQEQARRTQLIDDGQLIPARELAARLDISPQAISKAVKAGRLLALDSGSSLWYPAFYADGKLSRRELYTVTKALGTIPSSSKWQFFTTPKASLNGRTPIQALQQGDRDAVLVTAAGFVER